MYPQNSALEGRQIYESYKGKYYMPIYNRCEIYTKIKEVDK